MPILNLVMELVMALVGLVGLLLALVLAVAIGSWILRPLDRAAKNLQHPTQFTLIDFFCLFFLIQLPTGVIHLWLADTATEMRWLLDVYSWMSCAAMWGFSVQKLSRAGIHNPRHRGIFLAFVLPVAFFGSIAFPVVIPLTCILVSNNQVASPRTVVTWAVWIQIALVFGLYACGRFTRRMVAAVPSSAPGSPFGQPQG